MVGPIVLILVLAQASAPPVAPPAGSSQQPAAVAPAQTTPEQPWPPAGVLRTGGGVKSPRLVKDVKPMYTADARKANINGTVVLEAVVLADGTVGEVRVTRSLDKVNGLDDEAVKSVKKWQFSPGTKDGVAVPVVVEIEVTFTMRKNP